MPSIKDYNVHNWRTEKYYNEPVDNTIKAFFPILDALYKSYTSIKEPGRRE